MPDYQIKISAVDNATPIVDKAFKKTQASATSVSGKIGDRFRDVFENVTQNATGAFGSVAGGLFKLPGPAGIAAAAILALGGAAVASAKKYAEANAANDTASAQFLANLDKLKSSFSGLVNTVGSAAVGAFNSLAEAFGAAATAQEVLLRQEKAYNDLIVKQVSDTDAYVKKLNEILDADKKLLETGIIRDYFDAFAKGNLQLAGNYARQLQQLRLLATARKELSELEKKPIEPAKAKGDSGFKLELESAKRLGESILGTFRAIDEAERQAMKEGVEASIAAYERDKKEFEDELARKRKILELQEQLRQQQEAAYDSIRAKGIAAAQHIAGAFSNTVGGALERLIVDGEKFKSIWFSVVDSMLRFGIRSLFGGGPFSIFGFENGGILGRIPQAASGMMVNRDSIIRVGERNLPEVIIPLAPQKRDRANELMAQSGLAGNQTINFAPVIYANNADRNLVRELMTQFNRETRRGTKLYATNYKSNRR